MIQDGAKMFNTKKNIWFDFENAPQVWVLKPIYEYFKEKGYNCYCSARDFSYTAKLLSQVGIEAVVQPYFVSKSRFVKIINLLLRTHRLIKLFKNKKIDLAISHGSRSQILAAKFLKVPVISMEDYEKSDQFLVRFTEKTLVPSVIEKSNWGRFQHKIEHYPGIKENIYLTDYNPDRKNLKRLAGNGEQIVVLLRPEAATSHYYNKKSTDLLFGIIEHLSKTGNIKIIFLPRDKKQAKKVIEISEKFSVKYIIPNPAEFGFEIVGVADLVVGGGGTMLREAACLGVPAYSYFPGKWGSVDNYLLSAGRLVKIESKRDIKKIKLVKHNRVIDHLDSNTKEYILKFLERYIEIRR